MPAFEELLLSFDRINGGFGNAPKFPLPHTLLFLLRYSRLKGEERAVRMTEKTLRSMAMGGIYDHLGSGFHRYSTDTQWLVPHFEKMLYDQALLEHRIRRGISGYRGRIVWNHRKGVPGVCTPGDDRSGRGIFLCPWMRTRREKKGGIISGPRERSRISSTERLQQSQPVPGT